MTAPLDFVTLLAEWFRIQTRIGVDHEITFHGGKDIDGAFFVAHSPRAKHISRESYAHALDQLCEQFRPRPKRRAPSASSRTNTAADAASTTSASASSSQPSDDKRSDDQ